MGSVRVYMGSVIVRQEVWGSGEGQGMGMTSILGGIGGGDFGKIDMDGSEFVGSRRVGYNSG